MHRITQRRTQEEIIAWLIQNISELSGIPREQLDIHEAIVNYVTDSRDALGIAADLGAWLQTDIAASVVWDQPTIAALASHVMQSVFKTV